MELNPRHELHFGFEKGLDQFRTGLLMGRPWWPSQSCITKGGIRFNTNWGYPATLAINGCLGYNSGNLFRGSIPKWPGAREAGGKTGTPCRSPGGLKPSGLSNRSQRANSKRPWIWTLSSKHVWMICPRSTAINTRNKPSFNHNPPPGSKASGDFLQSCSRPLEHLPPWGHGIIWPIGRGHRLSSSKWLKASSKW